MANKKISDLTALTDAISDDLLAIVDDSASETKKITLANLIASALESQKMGGFQNLLTNSGFGVWSNSTLENYGSAIIDDDCADDDTGDWSLIDCTLAFDTDHYEINHTDPSQYIYRAATLTEGHLYELSVDVKDGTSSGVPGLLGAGQTAQNRDAGEIAFTTTGSWVTHTFVFVALSTTDTIAIGTSLSSGNIEVKNITLYEVTPGCIAASTHAMDEWQKSVTIDIWRQPNDNGTLTKDGSFYSLKMTPVAQDDYIVWPGGEAGYTEHCQKFAGRTVTFGAWIKTSTASDARVEVYDGTTITGSSYHTGGGSWEWLEVTATFQANPTYAQFIIRTKNASPGVAYISQPMLVFGSSIGEGNYSRPPGEIIWFEDNYNKLNGYAGDAQSDVVKTLSLESLSNGQIPKGIKAISFWVMWRDSGLGEDSSLYIALGESPDTTSTWRLYSHLGNDELILTRTPFLGCDLNGDIELKVNASGADTLDLYLAPVSVLL